MTYGSATTVEGVADYLNRIYRGKAPAATIEEFERRYRLIKKSPLVEITNKQAELLEGRLNETVDAGFVVRAGMRYSNPFIENALRDCQILGATRFVGVILSPQFSSVVMDGYLKEFYGAAEVLGIRKDTISLVEPWPTQQNFISLLADRIRETIQTSKENPLIIFTTHNLPKKVIDANPEYLIQLKATTDAVLRQLEIPNLSWTSAFQSAGHSPEEWLKPDLLDVLAQMKNGGTKSVLLVPIQFLSDHLEILYDLDIAAKKQCEECGVAYRRIELPNTDAGFVEALASLVLGSL